MGVQGLLGVWESARLSPRPSFPSPPPLISPILGLKPHVVIFSEAASVTSLKCYRDTSILNQEIEKSNTEASREQE